MYGLVGSLIFVVGVFGLGWNLADTSDQLIKISENFETAANQSKAWTGIIQNLDFSKIYQKEIKIVFVGDVMLSRGVAYQINKNSDYKYPFLKIADYLSSFDLTIGNLEGPISDKGTNQGSIYSFRADPRVVEGLNHAGFDLVSLANNHIFDWGREALLDTKNILKESDIKGIGAGKDHKTANEPAIFEINKEKLAFLSYTNLYPKSLNATEEQAGISDSSIENIIFNIERLKKEGYLVGILMHWGDEYQTKSNISQQKIARGVIDAGADLVVGHHPHVPQEIEQHKDKWIVYSLGNFVFDQNFSKETMRGMAVEVKIKNGQVIGVSPREIVISPTFQPQLTSN